MMLIYWDRQMRGSTTDSERAVFSFPRAVVFLIDQVAVAPRIELSWSPCAFATPNGSICYVLRYRPCHGLLPRGGDIIMR